MTTPVSTLASIEEHKTVSVEAVYSPRPLNRHMVVELASYMHVLIKHTVFCGNLKLSLRHICISLSTLAG